MAPRTQATGNNHGGSSKGPSGASKPTEAVTPAPDRRGDRSIVMPSTAAAQAASGVSVAHAGSAAAARADRQAAGGESTSLLPEPVAHASKT